jgi:hypothetical protein
MLLVLTELHIAPLNLVLLFWPTGGHVVQFSSSHDFQVMICQHRRGLTLTNTTRASRVRWVVSYYWPLASFRIVILLSSDMASLNFVPWVKYYIILSSL